MKREKKITHVGLVGIAANGLLAVFKAIVGILTGSIAIAVDALNNMSDMVSSIVTIICTRWANKAPDRRHPHGHGRLEYFSAIIVAGIILYAGILAIRESITKILVPNEVKYTAAALVVLVAAVIVKIALGIYTKKMGHKLQSQSLVASGQDALNDAILSSAALLAAILHLAFGVSWEGYFALVIAVYIIKTAFGMVREPLNDILGRRVDDKLIDRLRNYIGEFKEVKGVYDLDLHNYGPKKTVGSVHIQVRDDMTAAEIHALSRKIRFGVFDKFDMAITIGIYAANERGEYKEIRKAVEKLVEKREEVSGMHGFFVDDDKNVYFDIVVAFDCEKPSRVCKEMARELSAQFSDYDFNIIYDVDLSE